jgi:maleate cis-trans isomerase
MPAAYGWRARIGKLNPTVIASTWVYEFYKVAPPGVMLLTRNLSVKDVRNQEDLDASVALMEQAVKELKRAGADLILGAGIPVLLSGGPDGNEKILRLLSTLSGLPAITTLSSAVDAFRHLGVGRLAIATAYGKPELGEKLADFMRRQGFDVAGLSTIETGLASIEKPSLDFGFVYRYGKKVLQESNRPDVLYFPSSSWPTLQYVEHLERDIGMPVVSSAIASIWNAFRTLDIHEPVRGFGRLFATL